MSSTFRPCALEQTRNREHRADAHLVRLAARDGDAAVDAERREAALLARACASIDHARADAPSESWLALPAVMTSPSPRTGLSACETFERGVGAVAFVAARA